MEGNGNCNSNCNHSSTFSPQRRGDAEETVNTHDLNICSGAVVDGAMQVHSALGPGLLESAYELCLAHELRMRGIQVETQVAVPIIYKGFRLDAGYRIDLLVENEIVIEAKSVAKLLPVHEAQLLSYLRLANRRLGLLINFNIPHLRDGIKRMVNGLR